MRITRRGALLSIIPLATITAQHSTTEQPNTLYSINIPETFDAPLTDCKPVGGFDSAITCKGGKTKYDFAIEVRYKDRVVRFTPTELMDILEGKGL